MVCTGTKFILSLQLSEPILKNRKGNSKCTRRLLTKLKVLNVIEKGTYNFVCSTPVDPTLKLSHNEQKIRKRGSENKNEI